MENLPALIEVDFEEAAQKNLSVLSDVFMDRAIGIVLRKFLPADQVATVKSLIDGYPHGLFEPFTGYSALPRPFDQIGQHSVEDYRSEVGYLNSGDFTGLRETFLSQFGRVAGKTQFKTALPGQVHSLSEAWASARILQPGVGSFELHCGNLFPEWNQEFFAKQGVAFDIRQHLAFLMMVQRPAAQYDIEIYRAHWDTFRQKASSDALIDAHGHEVGLDRIVCHRILLNPGDLLIFDESNYWHRVTGFYGPERITFGGFISRFKEQDSVLLWA
jgi:hypothetical protein